MPLVEELASAPKAAQLVPPLLYALADHDTWGEETSEFVRVCAAEGVGWIQLRAKTLDDASFLRLAEASLESTQGSQTSLWINDRVDLAGLLGFAGVHLGQEDLPRVVARDLLGPSTWIGSSTHTALQAKAAQDDSAVDVVAMGPIFQTSSKKNAQPAVGLEGLRAARDLVSKPLIAIGGLDEDRAKAALEVGANTVAIVGALATDGLLGLARRVRAFHSALGGEP